ncbi:hypothetical protein NQ318_000579 [Aromia moschata]|uniref:DUF4817 domain-containing protein n=1 Tax=Aromia moschata TaxID=1265417 RepID=A0AAV8XAF6_9CUCU|nr:hypothetical protein NQ318_000579 [Aromia moschata]
MVNYSNFEMADMHFTYGCANSNVLNAQIIYAEQYPERRLPHRTPFTNIHQRLREFGKFEKRSRVSGRNREVRTEALEEDKPEQDNHQENKQCPKCKPFELKKKQRLYPYHFQWVEIDTVQASEIGPNEVIYSHKFVKETIGLTG